MDNTEKKRIKILNYRTGQGIAPKPENIVHGEIAIGYKKDNEAIYIKNSTDEIVDFTPISIVNIAYNELKELRDNSKLKPSQYYRITDFVTTVANDGEARSAGHPFDIIVLASDKDRLQEECYAIQREGDPYFANCNLAAWKIWYCLDNDNTKYMWADTANGKGVIYRMIDEWENDCPYDFKNVQFKRYWANGINTAKPGEPKNIILQGYYGTSSNADTFTEGIDTNDYLFLFTFTRLNNILLDYEKDSVTQSNVLDESIQTEGFDIDAKDDKLSNPRFYNFHSRCRNNILKPTETGLVVDTKEYMTFILLNNVFITVKGDDPEVYQPPFDNTLGVSCVNNTFGSNTYGLLFLSSCTNNSFGNDCYRNSFGNGCADNQFGNSCYYNQFGNYFQYNSFGNDCDSNTFGNDCDGNSFGNSCYYNQFGNNCWGNQFGNGCTYNQFGNNCDGNSFGNYFQYNQFGNYVRWNTFGNYFQYNALGNDVQYVEITTENIYHTQILNGTKGTDSKKLTIEFTPETEYSQFAGFTSDGVLKIWVEADDIVNITYNELKNLRDNSKLKPSQYYRITDFVTTVANDEEARSAGHPFDIIVMASKENKLQEECYAIQHEDDTYFANCNLAAWKIWYCLDNDNTKYAWADTAKGKGVIYRMIDEWQNDCPYDFKNVQFKRYWTNGINTAKTGNPKDIILQGYYGTSSNANTFTEGIDTNDNLFLFTFTRLNNISEGYAKGSVTQSNVLDESIQTEGFDTDAGKRCSNNILKPTETVLVVDTKKYMTFVLLNNVFITVKGDDPEVYQPPFDNTLGVSCVNNTFGNNTYGLLFLSSCANNSFGNGCANNSFGNGCYGNSFGNDCDNNSFGNDCDNNSFGNYCNRNSFGNDCDNNSFGDYYGCNSFGNRCVHNSFGVWCGSNSFGNNCVNNSFGTDYNGNSFGNDCDNNSFGNRCSRNSFGNNCDGNSFGNDFRYNALGNVIQYIEIPTEKIYHTQILNGTKGTEANKLTLEFTPETTYSQFAGFTSDGVLKIWVEADDIVNITYNKLKELRDTSKLKPSQYYRITDFITTVANDPEAQSAGHQFDIIVMASEKNKLQEECYAIQHEGDPYFANCNLAAWKIWYCLDNDTTKYAWADTAKGKGVIYRMIDEWENDCPYDFKNVQFKRYWANGINTAKTGNPKNIILQGYYGTLSNADTFTEGIDTNDHLFLFTFTRLNNILSDYEKGSVNQSNVLDESIQIEGFDIDAEDNKLNNPSAYTFHSRCRNNILKPTETGLVVDTKEYMTFILLNNVFITVKGYEPEVYQPPFDNTLGVSCVNNTFGSNTYGLLFLSSCTNNSFGDYFQYNQFGNSCSRNSFGNDCDGNSFGNYFQYNQFGNYFQYNQFGNDCYDNQFGNDCYGNSFGNSCANNSFGNNCDGNSFGNDCDGNSFGNSCDRNSFGNSCGRNSFGNDCYGNSFGNYFQYNSFGNYFQYNALGNDVQHVEIATEKIYHTQILNGTKGTDSKKLTIPFTPETTYSQFAGFTSDNVLKIWVEADAPHDTVDGGSY